MTDEPIQIIADPCQIQVTHITGVVSNIFNGQTIAMNLVTDRMGMRTDGSVFNDLIIAARLRFDLDVAIRIRDQINAHLSGIIATSPNTKPN